MNRRRPLYNPTFTVLTALFAILFTAALAVALVFVARYGSATEAYLAAESDAEYISESAQAEIEGLQDKLAALKHEVESLESEREQLIRTFADSDERYKMLLEQVAELESELAAKQREIARLHDDIAKLERVYKVDINAQFAIIEELENLLRSGAPMKQLKTVETDEAGEEIEKITEEYPRIALYYQDITHGYTYSYNDSEVFYSASCLKAPFALSLLQAATAELARSADESAERVFNFDQTYTYVSSDAQKGSGIIVKQPEGTEYTYLQLIELMLTHSDNVAFDQLKKKYSTAEFRALASRLGTSAMRKDLSTMTASDGGKVLTEIYEFIRSDSPFSQFMYDAMTRSNHRVMIPAAVPGKPVANKYGWDIGAYHDMGIVFDKNPYVVVILTDLDQGGSEVDTYIRNVLKLVNRLHENFYKN